MLGFHGTSEEIAELLVQGEAFRGSVGDNHWLGEGAYFFVDCASGNMLPAELAQRIAERDHTGEVAVIYAEIDEANALDLVGNRDHQEFVQQAYEKISPYLLPDQIPGHWQHPLDSYVIEFVCKLLEEAGEPVRSVRALLDEYPPLYAGTAIVADPHIQVAVRDLSAIDSPALW